MRTPCHPLLAAVLAVATAGLILTACAEAAGFRWQALNPAISTGQNVRIDVRLLDPGGKPVPANINVSSVRLDMGPDGMANMTTPIRPIASSQTGVASFAADIPMAGRWALTITGKAEGQTEPTTGIVIFTVTGPHAQNTPPRGTSGPRRVLYYRHPMGLPDTSPVPRKDAMGMDYIPVYSDQASDVPGAVRIDAARIQRSGVRMETAGRRNLSQTVRAVGTVDHAENRLGIVTSKFSGFVEMLYVATTGARVYRGQPLARVWIESNDILAKEADYLIALRGIGAPGDIKRAENNLRLFGVPESLIEELRRTGRPVRNITLTSPLNGVVVEKPAIRGMRFNAGDTLFKVADHTLVWVIAQVSERDLASLAVGQTARIALAAYADTPFVGRVSFIAPELDMASRTVQVRIEVANPEHRIKIGQYADVVIEAPAPGGMVVAIPESAVIDSGTRQVAFVGEGDGVFAPRQLLLGRRGGGYVEVRRGISEGERVVASGNFLIDAESNLNTAMTTFAADGTPQ